VNNLGGSRGEAEVEEVEEWRDEAAGASTPAIAGVLASLSSCTSEGELVSETDCTEAIAYATQAWRVNYYSTHTRLNPNNQRLVEFGSAKLVTRNGNIEPSKSQAKPVEPGTQKNGVWYPTVPPQPTARELAASRQRGERIGSPELYRAVKYTLVCGAGELEAGADTYQVALNQIQAEQQVRVAYSMGRVLKTILPTNAVIGNNPDSDWTPPTDDPSLRPEPTPSKTAPLPTILYVDAKNGSDRNSGNNQSPLKTITQAIAQVRPGMTIQLSPGVYNTETGEVFPLKLPQNVTLRGNPETQGKGIQIIDGGKFLSPTWAGQSITILATDHSQIIGLSLTNPNPRGTAIWIEAGAPLIEANRFVGSDREGVFASGTATPTVRNNLFEQNGGNGISFTRDSGGILEGNTVRYNGFGISVSDRASPKLIRNQISQNKDGMVINGDSRPLLTSNRIANNGRDGIVVTNNASPTLRQNSFSDNEQYDLHNTSKQPLNVEAGAIAGLKVEGKVN
jgi:parallel beta-helix repeat protein